MDSPRSQTPRAQTRLMDEILQVFQTSEPVLTEQAAQATDPGEPVETYRTVQATRTPQTSTSETAETTEASQAGPAFRSALTQSSRFSAPSNNYNQWCW